MGAAKKVGAGLNLGQHRPTRLFFAVFSLVLSKQAKCRLVLALIETGLIEMAVDLEYSCSPTASARQ